MAQPPDYGSYVKREPKRFSLVRFIKIAAIVTLVLALIEVGFIYFFMSSKSDNNKPSELGKTIANSDSLPRKIDSSFIFNQPIPIVTDTIATPKIIPPSFEKIIDSSKKVINPENKIAVIIPPKVVPKVDAIKVTDAIKSGLKELNNARMVGILDKLKKEKLRRKNNSNCVQIRKTSNSNVTNAFKIAEYLKDRGYIIGGRLTVSGSVTGVKVDASKDCIELTIGTL